MEIRKDGVARVSIYDGERFVAGPLTAPVDLVGVRCAPVVLRRKFDCGGPMLCHAAMIATDGEGSKESCQEIFTHY